MLQCNDLPKAIIHDLALGGIQTAVAEFKSNLSDFMTTDPQNQLDPKPDRLAVLQ